MATINFKKSYAPVPPPVKVPVFKKTYTASPDGLPVTAPVPEKSLYDRINDFITVLKTDPRTNTSRLDDWKISLDGYKADYEAGDDTQKEYEWNILGIKDALVRIARDAERGNLIPAEFKGGRKKTKRSKRVHKKTSKRKH